MKTQRPYEGVVAVVLLLLWVIVVAIKVIQGGRDAWSLPYILQITPITALLTFLLCQFWVVRKKPVPYGILLSGPFSALLVFMSHESYYKGWGVFTYYWHDIKGGLFGFLLHEVVIVGGFCALPAIAIVAYYRRKVNVA